MAVKTLLPTLHKRVHPLASPVYQQGLLTLRKLRQNGHQRIVVQYVNVREGGQAVIGNIDKDVVAIHEP